MKQEQNMPEKKIHNFCTIAPIMNQLYVKT